MQNFIEQLVENKTYNCQVVGTAPGAYAVTLHDSSTGNSLSEDVNRLVTKVSFKVSKSQGYIY